MSTPTPPKKRWFFRKTRELGEKEWVHGLRTNPLKRMFRASRRTALIQHITDKNAQAKMFRKALGKYVHESTLSVAPILTSRNGVEGNVAEHVLDVIGMVGRSKMTHSKSEKVYLFHFKREPSELGTFTTQYDPTTRKMVVKVALSTDGVMTIGREFPEPYWKRTLSRETGLSTYTWRQTIPELTVQAAVEWRQARIEADIKLDHYRKDYANKNPVKKTRSRRS